MEFTFGAYRWEREGEREREREREREGGREGEMESSEGDRMISMISVSIAMVSTLKLL